MREDILIHLEAVGKIYAPEDMAQTTALHSVNLDVFRGEFIALTGPSGSGKSTLLNIIGLLDTATSGTYVLRGKSMDDVSEEERSQYRLNTLGIVFQFFNLIDNFTALENIAFQAELQGIPSQEAQINAEKILEFLGLRDKRDLFPGELSGGEQQRVALGRALIKNPLVLLADEPTAHLDSKNADQVMRLLRLINERLGCTILLVTHEPNQALLADRQVILRDGQVAEIVINSRFRERQDTVH